MSRRFLALSLALCAPCAAVAAPVPPPRLVTAEAVVKPPRGDLRELAAKLASAPFLSGVARSRTAAGLACLSGENPSAWLAARLRASVDADRGTVVLRLEGCPRRDAVALLAAVVEAYKADLLQAGRAAAQLREKEVVVRVLLAAQAANGAPVNVNNLKVLGKYEEVEGPSRAEADRSVLQPPRVVQPGLPGKVRR
jgi:hypothetical protein